MMKTTERTTLCHVCGELFEPAPNAPIPLNGVPLASRKGETTAYPVGVCDKHPRSTKETPGPGTLSWLAGYFMGRKAERIVVIPAKGMASSIYWKPEGADPTDSRGGWRECRPMGPRSLTQAEADALLAYFKETSPDAAIVEHTDWRRRVASFDELFEAP